MTKRKIVTTSDDPILAQIGQLIDGRITERLLAYHRGLEEDFGLVRIKPKSSVGQPAAPSDDD